MGKGKATEEQLNNPLHGVKLIQILEHLVESIGWEAMADAVNINAFKNRPTIKSSLRFLRRTEWARRKVENLYLELITPEFHESVYTMWAAFQAKNPEYQDKDFTDSFNFCDNEKDAKECGQLTEDRIKQATSTSLWWFEHFKEALPEVGNIYVISDWYGIAKAIVRTTSVEKIPFNEVSDEYAAIEGEGDKSLEHWKKTHWDYYTRDMEPEGYFPKEDMLIVCEKFETLWNTKSN